MILFIVLTAFTFVILLNLWLIRYKVNKIVKTTIISHLNSKGLKYLGHKWAGFFYSERFDDDNSVQIPFFIMRPNPFASLYVFVYVQEQQAEKRITAKINTFLYITSKVILQQSDRVSFTKKDHLLNGSSLLQLLNIL